MTDSTPGIALPDVHASVLDADTLDQLLFDLSQLAEVLDVRVKAGPTDRASTAAPSLSDARAALAHGAAGGVQIRYRFQGVEWIDTLMKTGEGVRLIRVRAWLQAPDAP